MLALKAVLLGAVQGVSEFFPVSSSGHISFFADLLGVNIDLMFVIMLHIGSLAAVVLYFRRELARCVLEFAGIFADLYFNLKAFFAHAGDAADGSYYRRILSNSYRKLSVLLIAAVVPTIIIGALLAPLIELLSGNILCSGMGLFITALILLIASFERSGRKGPKEARAGDAVMTGIFQGASVFPGVSRYALTYSSGLYRGFSRKFSRLFSFLMFVPVTVGALLAEGTHLRWSAPAIGIMPSVLGMLSAMATGFFVVRFAMKAVERIPVRIFSIYCFCMGAVSVVFYLI